MNLTIFFMDIGPNLAKTIPCTNANNFTKLLRNMNINGFRFTEIQEESVSQIRYNLPNKNSYGFDRISSKLLKLIEPEIVKPLTLLITQDNFLTNLKYPVTKVIPIFKNFFYYIHKL